MELISSVKCFDGWLKRYRHQASSVKGEMIFALYLPPQAEVEDVPVVYWLSGLTCTDENFCQKAGAFAKAAELGLAIVCPDTSPRGCGIEGEDDSYDLGSGAGFYVNATNAPWREHYRMYDYVVSELPGLIEQHFPVTDQRAISGHSMGGHGALVCALSNRDRYSSVSAFAPIVNPSSCPWGRKAFSAYLGSNENDWLEYDACELISHPGKQLPMLVDQGLADQFLEEQLNPEHLEQAALKAGYPVDIRLQPGYDHSYYFISSFIDEHLAFHARYL